MKFLSYLWNYRKIVRHLDHLYLSLNLKPTKGQNMNISDEIDAIQAAVNPLLNPTTPTPVDFLTPPTQAKLDALATSLKIDLSPPTPPAGGS